MNFCDDLGNKKSCDVVYAWPLTKTPRNFVFVPRSWQDEKTSFFISLPSSKFTISLISIYKHYAIDIADPTSMEDAYLMNFVESLWLSGRASEREIRRSEVRFLVGTQNFCFVPRSWLDGKTSFFISLPSSKFTISLISIYKHYAIDIADPTSMEDAYLMNFVESLWLSGRASEREIRRSEVRFLVGTQNFCFVPRSWLDGKKKKKTFCFRNPGNSKSVKNNVNILTSTWTLYSRMLHFTVCLISFLNREWWTMNSVNSS